MGGRVHFARLTTDRDARFSDVSHEVLPVRAGYRLVLTFNLAMSAEAAEVPSAATAIHHKSQALRKALERWSSSAQTGRLNPDALYYALEHKYTEANFSLKALKGADRVRVECLKRLCADLGFDVFLATLEKMEFGPTEDIGESHNYRRYDDSGGDDEDEDEDPYDDGEDFHYLEEVVESSHTLKVVFDLAGTRIASALPLNGICLIQDEVFGEEPDQEDYEGYMVC